MWRKVNLRRLAISLSLMAFACLIGLASPSSARAQTYQEQLAAAACHDDVVALVNRLAKERGVRVAPPGVAISPLADQDQSGRLVAFNAATAEPLGQPQPGDFLALFGIAGGVNEDAAELPAGVYEARFGGYTPDGAVITATNVDTGEVTAVEAALVGSDWQGPRIGFSVHIEIEAHLFPPRIYVKVTIDIKFFGREWKKTWRYRLL